MPLNFPNSPSLNDEYTFGGSTYVWNGTVWGVKAATVADGVHMSDTAPANPGAGDLWWRTDDGRLYIYYEDADSSQWVEANSALTPAGAVTVSSTAPSNPSVGDLWYDDSDTHRMYVYYNDGTSSYWTDSNPDSRPQKHVGTDAWASVESTGTISASYNIDSVTRTGTGVYEVSFSNLMPNSSYAITFGAASNNISYSAQTTSGFEVQILNNSLSAADFDFSFAVNATNATLPNSFTEDQIQSVVNLAKSGVTNPGASAWGHVAADGTIGGGLNIASVTRTGTGVFDVVFTTPMPDDKYCVNGSIRNPVSWSAGGFTVGAQTPDGFTINTGYLSTANVAYDYDFSFAVFATNALPPTGGTGTDAWGSVQSDGTLDASFNVASVTKVSTDVYDVVFTTSMPTSSFSVACTSNTDDNAIIRITNKSVSGFRVNTSNTSNNAISAAFDFQVNATNATLPDSFTESQIQTIIDHAQSGVTNPGASAWADVAGDGTLNNGLNIASVTRTALGYYTVVFDTPMPDSNYAVTGSVNGSNSSVFFVANNTKTATGFTYGMVASTNGSQSVDGKVAFTVFATNALPPKGGTGTDAWGNIGADGTEAGTFNASVNRTGLGSYTVTFTTPMPTANYSVVLGSGQSSIAALSSGNKTVNGFTVSIYANLANGTLLDGNFNFTVNATNATLPTTFTESQIQSVVDLAEAGTVGLFSSYAILKDVKTQNTDGGAVTTGSWETRDLNTESADPDGIVELSSNQFTLQTGTYLIEASAPGHRCGYHMIKLYNVTSSSDVDFGTSEYSQNANGRVQSTSLLKSRVVVSGPTTFQIQHKVTTNRSPDGLGTATNLGPETYTIVEIKKEI